METRRNSPAEVLLIRPCHGLAAFLACTIMDLEAVPLASDSLFFHSLLVTSNYLR